MVRAAKAGEGTGGEWAEDAVLRQNRAGLKDAAADGERPLRGGSAPAGSLAGSGRSRLGD